MRHSCFILAGLLLAATAGHAQTATPLPAAPTPEPTDKWQLRVGLNAARILRNGGYYGLGSRLPLSAGIEYALNPRFTLYGQVDAELSVPRYDDFAKFRYPMFPSGAMSLGTRYYYNQAGRARQNRAYGSFVGNYLALESHLEMTRSVGYVTTGPGPGDGHFVLHTQYSPSLNLLWGTQRRLSRSFLVDFNAGVGISPARYDSHFGGYSSGALNLSTQVNLGVYFGH